MIRTFGVSLLVIAFAITGCNSSSELQNDEKENIPQDNPYIEDDYFINAKVEDASKYSDVVSVILTAPHPYNPCGVEYMLIEGAESPPCDEYIELARGEWKDGGFTIELPKTKETDYLEPLNLPPTLSISNKNVKFKDSGFIGMNKDGFGLYGFYLMKQSVEGDVSRAIFRYIDSDVTISGNHQIVYSSTYELSVTYSIDLKKGWNVWYYSSSISRVDGKIIVVEQWSSTPVSGLKWYGQSPSGWTR